MNAKKTKKGTNCQICGKWNSCEANLKNHLFTHTPSRSFKCPLCEQTFRQPSVLAAHKRRIHTTTTEKPHKCSMCQKGFKSRYELRGHYETHKPKNERKIHFCNVCSKQFFRNTHLTRHYKLEHGEGKDVRDQVCGFCNKAFKSYDVLNKHMRTHTKENAYGTFHCKLCGKMLCVKSALKTHIYRMHNKNVVVVVNKIIRDESKSSSIESSASASSIYCHQCTLGPFKDQEALSKHLAIHVNKNEQTNQCPICKVQFTCLNKHIETTHKQVDIRKEFTRTKSFNQHMRNQHSDSDEGRKNRCKICSKIFSSPETLANHIRGIHTGDRPFKCTYCGKSFTQRAHQITHERNIHLQLKPFPCGICGKPFVDKPRLDIHMRVHTREKPYKCEMEGCNKTFRYSTSIDYHQKSCHNVGQRFDWLCTECGKTFVTKTERNHHVRRVHAREKNITCTICGKSFFSISECNLHVRTHTGETPFNCRYCHKGFISSSGQYKHEIGIHGSKFTT